MRSYSTHYAHFNEQTHANKMLGILNVIRKIPHLEYGSRSINALISLFLCVFVMLLPVSSITGTFIMVQNFLL